MDSKTTHNLNQYIPPNKNTGNTQCIPQSSGVCPHCGYCPHCGRGGHYAQPYPYWQPYNPPFTWTTGGAGGVTQDPSYRLQVYNGDPFKSQN